MKIKSRKFAPKTEMLKNETHEMTTLMAYITASTFEWQKCISYEETLRIVKYMLHILPKLSDRRTNSGSITVRDALLEAEHRLFLLVQTESFPAPKKDLMKASAINKDSVFLTLSPFIGLNELLRATGRTKQMEIATFDVRPPILLNSQHPLVSLDLQRLHNKHCH